MKATATAPANVPFVKYMGRKDETLRLPENASISMNLSKLLTTTTVEFSLSREADSVVIDGQEIKGEAARVIAHLDRVRALAGITDRARVVSENSFPTSTGLSSSSSGFAALTLAAAAAAGLQLDERELSVLARQGSGSSCRSIPDGFVEWLDASASEESYAYSLHPPEYWGIADVVGLVSTERKRVGSSTAHRSVSMGPYYRARIARMPEKVKRCKEYLKARDFSSLGMLAEEEALDLHVIFMSAGIIYLTPQSLQLVRLVPEWRSQGLPVYFTLNTGQDVHLLCEKKDVEAAQKKLKELDFVREVIVNEPARGARLAGEHLF